MNPSVLAVIPARANSKRIPEKNKKDFLGKPLIEWTILAALGAEVVTDVVVSTDDSDILSMQEYHPEVTFIRRPEELALDQTPGIDPVLDLMSKSQRRYDYVILLQPTSPLRNSTHINEAFWQLTKKQKNQLVSVRDAMDNLNHCVVCTDTGVQLLKNNISGWPGAENIKVLNGAIYISQWDYLLEVKTFMRPDAELFLMDVSSSVDIDLPSDWQMAECFGRMKEL